MATDEKPETTETPKESPQDKKLWRWAWFVLGFFFVLMLLGIAVNVGLITIWTILVIFILLLFFIGILLFIIWFFFWRQKKEKITPEISRIEAQNISFKTAELPPRRGGMLKTLSKKKVIFSAVRRKGREGKQKTKIFQLRTHGEYDNNIYDVAVRMDNPDDRFMIMKNPFEEWKDYEVRVESMLNDLAETAQQEERTTFYDKDTGTPTRTTTKPVITVPEEEKEELT